MKTAPAIELQSASRSFKQDAGNVVAMNQVSLTIQEGQIAGIIGRSGAGKSTLLRTLNGLESVDSGSVLYKGKNLGELSRDQLRKSRHEIGMIFQHFNLLSRRTVLENVLLPLEIIGLDKGSRLAKAKACIELVGLKGRESAYPSELSGGQKQRVAIARTLASDAKVILSDEATSALDPETTQDILQLLKSLNERLGITIVLITHEIGVIRDICDTVYVMDAGSVVEHGKTEAIFTNPRHAVTQSFISSYFQNTIPPVVQAALQESPAKNIAIRLLFQGNSAQEPVIAHMIREFNTDVNILAGFIDHIGSTTFGNLVIKLENDAPTLSQVESYLKSQGVVTERLGYLP